ncbi:MAG TPA: 16S rRNA (cytosine(1402)-N(4))-methyltransferase RsmH [Anaerolinea thermolimosa]|uniref:Ribosomal RNA small subunit methyltransferase H n=1 Tax=Anaerolinea thermolimosa TaxID=229919 RepID=A0A3D1JHV1_9CHLR|nr:16S rRNA (cytosine(1402)-N(4))-methyltransferase RsmH [Anaerolinea thermolimosa]GAP07094.1 16S rRNA (cytosine(1402)-N(4))-methyltransferase [Anaerolinea thermolimosa]HCE18063.1 16S rRNA (cytosine(1402)-N(4))-methyltransferase RsmH [Anaerolinea thermolimosa]
MDKPQSGTNPPHRSVLYQEIILALNPHPAGHYVDATLGAGGHAEGILEASNPDGKLLGFDLDPHALEIARNRLARFGGRVFLRQSSYLHLKEELDRLGWPSVDGIVFDLGVSSMQLDTPQRGFSFQAEGPLDMRFGPEGSITAALLVNELPERELAALIWKYGEEHLARRIAHAIVQARPLRTTQELAEVIVRACKGQRSHIHPATRTFQALRIAVNEELQTLEAALPQAVSVLAPGGRLAVISFHSLEDRLVKQFFRRESRDCICPPDQPVCTCEHQASIREITRHPIEPGEEEIAQNPRARSAKLRVAEKLPTGMSVAQD